MGLCSSKDQKVSSATIAVGEVFLPESKKKSGNGRYRLFHDSKRGRLFITKSKGRVIWSTARRKVSSSKFVVQSDGNAVLYGSDGKPIWSTNTTGVSARELLLTDDGNLELRDERGAVAWQSKSRQVEFTGDTIRRGAFLDIDDAATSKNGKYQLKMTAERLVLTRASNGREVWTPPASKRTCTHATLQEDGNFVVYNHADVVFRTDTANMGGEQVKIQDDGNIVLINDKGRVLWASNSGQPPLSDQLEVDQFLDLGEELRSGNGQFSLCFCDGDLVIKSTTNDEIVWESANSAGNCAKQGSTSGGRSNSKIVRSNKSSATSATRAGGEVESDGTSSTPVVSRQNTPFFALLGPSQDQSAVEQPQQPAARDAKWLTLQRDGNLVLYAGGPLNEVLWASGAHGKRVTCMSLTDDGNLVLWDHDDKVVWCLDKKKLTRRGSFDDLSAAAAGSPPSVAHSASSATGGVFGNYGNGGAGFNSLMLASPTSLLRGHELRPGQFLRSENCRFILAFVREYGTLALFSAHTTSKSPQTGPRSPTLANNINAAGFGSPIAGSLDNLQMEDALWIAGNFRRRHADRAVFRSDGTLAIMAATAVLWTAAPAPNRPSPVAGIGRTIASTTTDATIAKVTDDGNFVLTNDAGDVVWETNSGDDVLLPGMRLTVRRRLKSRNNRYAVVVTTDGAFLNDRLTGATLWRTPTSQCDHLLLTKFGNILVRDFDKDGEWEVQWSSDTVGLQDKTYLKLQDDGNLLLLDHDDTILWSSSTNTSTVT